MDETFAADLIWGESLQNKERLYLLLRLIKTEQHETAKEIWSEERDFCFVCLSKGIKGRGEEEKQLTRSLRARISCEGMQMSEDGAPHINKISPFVRRQRNTLKQCRSQHIQHIGSAWEKSCVSETAGVQWESLLKAKSQLNVPYEAFR